MSDIEKLVEQINDELVVKMEQLEVLEKEKREIIDRYAVANSAEKYLLEIEMKKSEDKFKNLCDEVLAISKKVDKIDNN